MVDLTVVVLTKNEEKNIQKCIRSFRGIAKRYVVVDSFSEDNTKQICFELKKYYNIDFYEHEFINHADQFNWALKNTDINTEWVMRIDADEELTEELVNDISDKLPNVKPNVNGIIVNRRIYFLGRWIKHGGLYPMKVLRIFRRNKAFCEQKMMDEHIVLVEGEAIYFNSDIIDNNTKDLDWWINKHNWYSHREVIDYYHNKNAYLENSQIEQSLWKGQAERKRWLKNNFYYKMPLFKRAKWYFLYRYFLRLGFLDGKEGLIYHFLQAYWYRFLVDAKIYEHEKKGTELALMDSLKD